jgi:hypothetical protein
MCARTPAGRAIPRVHFLRRISVKDRKLVEEPEGPIETRVRLRWHV